MSSQNPPVNLPRKRFQKARKAHKKLKVKKMAKKKNRTERQSLLKKKKKFDGRFIEGIIITQFSILTVKQNKQAASTVDFKLRLL